MWRGRFSGTARSCRWKEATAVSSNDRMHTLGAEVRERRTQLRLTQDDLADLAGCSPRFVRSLESGKASVRVDKLVDVLDALGLELAARVRTAR